MRNFHIVTITGTSDEALSRKFNERVADILDSTLANTDVHLVSAHPFTAPDGDSGLICILREYDRRGSR